MDPPARELLGDLSIMPAKISVILPTYNRAQSLPMAAKSVLEQSYRDLELIVVDDASTEDIEAVVRQLGDDRVRYVRQPENRGAAAARNRGLVEAHGTLIAFQDSDDMWLPGKLERQVALLEAQGPEVGVVIGSKICHGYGADTSHGPDKVSILPAPNHFMKLDEDQVRRLFIENRISLQNGLFRRDCYPEAAWFDPCAKANNDWEFTVRLVQHTKVFEDPLPVVLAFVSGDSISTGYRRKALGTVRVLKKNREVLDQYKDVQARIFFMLGRSLLNQGKPRQARKFLLESVRRHPPLLLEIARGAVRRALRG